MTGEHSTNPTARELTPKKKKKSKKSAKKASKPSIPAGLVDSTRLGQDMAVLAGGKAKFPFYFPGLRTNRSEYVSGSPRVYKVADEDGKNHNAYRIVSSIGENGEYWGVQGMTWKNPPILDNPDGTRVENGRKLLLFYDGSKLRMVGWKTPRAAYWVTNTIGHKIPNSQLIAIAASLKRLKS